MGAARHRLGRCGPCDDAGAFAADAMAEASRSATSRPVLALGEDRGAFDQPSRHRQDHRHGHVGGVFGQNFRRVVT